MTRSMYLICVFIICHVCFWHYQSACIIVAYKPFYNWFSLLMETTEKMIQYSWSAIISTVWSVQYEDVIKAFFNVFCRLGQKDHL